MYKVTLSNGHIITGLRVNGNTFISSGEVTPEIFAGGLGRVVVSCDGEETGDFPVSGVYEHCRLDLCRKVGNEYWFVFAEMSREELERLQTQGNIDYIAMMTGVEL